MVLETVNERVLEHVCKVIVLRRTIDMFTWCFRSECCARSCVWTGKVLNYSMTSRWPTTSSTAQSVVDHTRFDRFFLSSSRCGTRVEANKLVPTDFVNCRRSFDSCESCSALAANCGRNLQDRAFYAGAVTPSKPVLEESGAVLDLIEVEKSAFYYFMHVLLKLDIGARWEQLELWWRWCRLYLVHLQYRWSSHVVALPGKQSWDIKDVQKVAGLASQMLEVIYCEINYYMLYSIVLVL